ncbi:hypothetical protein WMY93_024314 [Mugilogobius chulae]|uniref:Uncharacterized protein n=1 Tax=Mugilogobius chulae TaxID=88201 RepID=A0AAW0N4W0_9GOBI
MVLVSNSKQHGLVLTTLKSFSSASTETVTAQCKVQSADGCPHRTTVKAHLWFSSTICSLKCSRRKPQWIWSMKNIHHHWHHLWKSCSRFIFVPHISLCLVIVQLSPKRSNQDFHCQRLFLANTRCTCTWTVYNSKEPVFQLQTPTVWNLSCGRRSQSEPLSSLIDVDIYKTPETTCPFKARRPQQQGDLLGEKAAQVCVETASDGSVQSRLRRKRTCGDWSISKELPDPRNYTNSSTFFAIHVRPEFLS